jgi:hypothetical protein
VNCAEAGIGFVGTQLLDRSREPLRDLAVLGKAKLVAGRLGGSAV